MNPSAPFIHRPVATSLLALALVLVGALGFYLMPVAPLPELDFPVIEVSANLPGASPETMASNVATPLERAFGGIAGLSRMSSSSSQGSTQIALEFALEKNIDDAAREVQAAINAARPLLPSGMPENPRYRKYNPSQAPIIVLALSSNSLDAGQLYDVAATVLAQKLAQINGVGEVQLGGGSLPAVRVELEPHALNQYGIALEQVRTAISSANAVIPKGSVENGDYHWQIQANDQLRDAAAYRALIISPAGRPPVRLGDVATVYDSVENRYSAGFHNDRPAVLLIVNRQPNANIIATVDAIHAQLPTLRALLPASVDMAVTLDRSPGIRATLGEAQHTLLLAVGLVVLVVFVFLGDLRAALIPTLAVPVALIGAFAIMYLCGFSLNNLSLMALIIATGLVVDDAIVVMENISRHIDRGASPLRAALEGSREVGFTLLSMNLSLVVIFIAILFMGGFVERLFREFSISLVAAVGVSLAVSLTLTPALCARLLRPQQPGARAFERLAAAYQHSLDWALAHGRLLLALLVATIGLNVYLYVVIPKTLLPEQDTGQLMAFARGDDGLSFQAMQPKLEAYRKTLLADPAVADIVGFIGGDMGINNAFMLVRLKPLAERGESSQAVIERISKNLPQLPGGRLFMAVDQDIRLDAHNRRGVQHRYLLLASDLADLREWGVKVSDALGALPELTDVDGRSDEGALQVTLNVDREAARRLGVDMAAVTQVLNNSFSQRQVATIYNDLNQYRVVMEVAPRYAQSPRALDRVYVIAADGRRVPLSAFASYGYSLAPDRVSHDGQFAAVDIGFNLAPGVSLSEATAAIDRAMAEIMLPTAVQGKMGGSGDALAKSQQDQPLLILGALLTVYIVLGILYESYVHPLTILSTLPSAGVGALLALLALGTEFSLISLLGLFLLIGIVKKNAILIIDFALDAERNRGLSPREAIREAALLRFRPILMTSLAAVLGALPLMLAGDGGEMRQPLGITIVGGLVVSQLLTLYTTPVVYLYLDRFRWWALRRRGAAMPRHAE